MTKREPLQQWWEGDAPASKTTIVTDGSDWYLYRKGSDVVDEIYATWTEAMEAATR